MGQRLNGVHLGRTTDQRTNPYLPRGRPSGKHRVLGPCPKGNANPATVMYSGCTRVGGGRTWVVANKKGTHEQGQAWPDCLEAASGLPGVRGCHDHPRQAARLREVSCTRHTRSSSIRRATSVPTRTASCCT